MSVRGKMFPSLVERAGDGYKLCIPVPSQDNGGTVCPVWIPPPRCIVDLDTDIWPTYCFQLLLVASEYCAALHEFLTWEFVDEWRPLRAAVVAHARHFIRSSAAVPPPSSLPTPTTTTTASPQDDWRASSAHAVWATFTYCYFNGIRDLNPDQLSEGAQHANKWLKRLVGDRGWQAEGLVFTAASHWVRSMRERLQPLFPGVKALQAYDWQGTGYGGVERLVTLRGDKQEGDRYMPVYPYRLSGNYGSNRIKFTVNKQAAPRSVKGCCGVPRDYGQTNNCALGYLLLADVMQSFFEASRCWPKLGGEVEKALCGAFFGGVLESDTAPLPLEHRDYHYPAYLAGCALGWELALQQLPRWVAAAAGSAAAARGAAGGYPRGGSADLLLPRDLSLQACFDLWSQQQQQQQLLPDGHQQHHHQQHHHQQQHPHQPSPLAPAIGGPPALSHQPQRPPPQQQLPPSGPHPADADLAAAATAAATATTAAAATADVAAGVPSRGTVLLGGLLAGPLLAQPPPLPLPPAMVGGSPPLAGVISSGSSGTAAVSPFLEIMHQQHQHQQQHQHHQQHQQQHQQQQHQLQYQQHQHPRYPTIAVATPTFTAPGVAGTIPLRDQPAGAAPPPYFPSIPGTPSPLLPQPQPPPQPQPHALASGPLTDEVAGGVSAMSLDPEGSLAIFGEEMLRLIQEEALKPGVGGPPGGSPIPGGHPGGY